MIDTIQNSIARVSNGLDVQRDMLEAIMRVLDISQPKLASMNQPVEMPNMPGTLVRIDASLHMLEARVGEHVNMQRMILSALTEPPNANAASGSALGMDKARAYDMRGG